MATRTYATDAMPESNDTYRRQPVCVALGPEIRSVADAQTAVREAAQRYPDFEQSANVAIGTRAVDMFDRDATLSQFTPGQWAAKIIETGADERISAACFPDPAELFEARSVCAARELDVSVERTEAIYFVTSDDGEQIIGTATQPVR